MQKSARLLTKKYHGGRCINPRNVLARYKKYSAEFVPGITVTVSSRMKIFFALRHTVRRSHLLLAFRFHATAQLTALMTQHSGPLFS